MIRSCLLLLLFRLPLERDRESNNQTDRHWQRRGSSSVCACVGVYTLGTSRVISLFRSFLLTKREEEEEEVSGVSDASLLVCWLENPLRVCTIFLRCL